MNYRKIAIGMVTIGLMTGCVSKKKYNELQAKHDNTRSELQKARVENEKMEDKYGRIKRRVAAYNERIARLKDENEDMLVQVEDVAVVSESDRKRMRQTLQNVDQEKLSKAQTLKDSMNLAMSYNLNKKMGNTAPEEMLDINMDGTVVRLNIADDLLFKSSSYRVGNKADELLGKIANVLNSEPSLEIMVEGHTDDRVVKEGSYVKDNWDLSTERAAAIVRKLQEDFNVAPEQMIVAGRSSYAPLVKNDSSDNRAKNRRTRIVIMPNLNKFLSMMAQEERMEDSNPNARPQLQKN